MPKAKPFEFRMGERKLVPGHKDIQGVITMPASPEDLRTPVPASADGRHHLTFMRWFDERGQAQTGWFPVPQVQEANPPPAMSAREGALAIARDMRTALKADTKSRARKR